MTRLIILATFTKTELFMNQTSYGREGVYSEHLYARGPYTSNVSNYNRYLHDLLQLVGEEFNDTVITEVRTRGVICRNKYRKWELCTSP